MSDRMRAHVLKEHSLKEHSLKGHSLKRHGLRRHTVAVGDTVMDYITFGEGTKPMVLIPGLSFKTVKKFAEPFALMYRIFGKHFQVYAFDRKEDIPVGYTIKQMADDLAEAMEKIGIADAYVMGISQGGMMAQYLAIDHPHLVHKLALAVTLSRLNDTARNVITEWTRLAVNGDYETIAETMLKDVYSDAYIKRYGKYFHLVSWLGKPKHMDRFAILARACLSCHTYDDLTNIQCPVFVIGGGKDKVLSGEASVEIAEKLGCPMYLYPDLGHSAYEEAPDFNQRVLDFFLSEDTHRRCRWCNLKNPVYVDYHDTEWGVPEHDDQKLFELLILECFQAGLSWECVLNKRTYFREAFDQFDLETVCGYGEEKIAELLQNKNLIRNRLKMRAAVNNAKIFREIQREYGTFAEYLWHFTDGKTIYETDKTRSDLSDLVSKDLKKRGMKFVGTTIIYSYLQAAGIINSHEEECFLYQKPDAL